jgi:hypothetical protein
MAFEKTGRGRPRKFDRPSRPVTVTLPEDVIARLGAADGDLGKAIVRLAEKSPARPRQTKKSAELFAYGRHAVILVRPVRALSRMPGVQLVPVSEGRALIALDHPHGVSQLELDLRDALDNRSVPPGDRTVLKAITDILKSCRLSHNLSVAERSIIVLESRRRRHASA